MVLMRLWADVVRSSLFVRLVTFLLIGAIFVPSAHAGAKRKPAVLVVYAAASGYALDVQNKLNSSGQFSSVVLFNAAGASPSLATLQLYDAVLLFSDSSFSNTTILGNNLADYVDSGGGVVNATFSVGALSPPAGRWNPGYLCMVAGAGQVNTPATLDLASITNPNHPVLIGVGSFNGGTNSFRINQNSVVAGATIVAKWTGGNVLSAVGPLPGRADLNFYPPSKDADSRFWDTSTDGIKLMVNSLLYVMRPRILIAGAPGTATWNDDVKAKLAGTGVLGIIDIFNTNTGTPTLAQLQGYDAVLVYSDLGFQNQTALGNALADYVDAGGGVVSAVFATSAGYSNARIAGRWAGPYELITGNSFQTSGAASLGAVSYPAHPVMTSVGSFNGGTSSFRQVTSALNPGAFNIAQWNDGRPLIVASTKFYNRIDIGFYPPSSTVLAGAWVVGTNGDKIMANALLCTAKPYILLASADPFGADVTTKLSASRRFSKVDAFDAHTATPTLTTLTPYNAVAAWADTTYFNPTALGNVLADYIDAGGGEVAGIFDLCTTSSPQGRWVSQGYEITPSPLPAPISGVMSAGAVLEPSHPILSFVRKFDGGLSCFRQGTTPLLRGRTIMRWADGKMLVSVHNSRKRADLGYWPVSDTTVNGWNARTDGTWITANALEWVVRAKPCPGDLNGDGQVDDSDFVLFAARYDALLDPRGDLNGDGQTDDADFVIFAAGYDALLCP